MASAVAAFGATTAKFHIEYDFAGEETVPGVPMTLSGSGDGLADPAAEALSVAYSEVAGSSGEVLIIGENAWARDPGLPGEYGRKWRESLSAVAFNGLEPWRLMAALSSVDGVAGTRADGYAGTLDLTLEQGENGLQLGGFAGMAITTAGQGIALEAVPVRIVLDASGALSTVEVGTGEGDRRMKVSYRFESYGVAVDLNAPDPADVVKMPKPGDGDGVKICTQKPDGTFDCPGGPGGGTVPVPR